MKITYDFKANPQHVLKAATDFNPAAVAVVCRSANGQVVVYSSIGRTQTIALFERGLTRIDELTEPDGSTYRAVA